MGRRPPTLPRAQHEAFQALSFREKLLRLEEMDEVAKQLAGQAPSPVQPPPPGPPGHSGST